MYFNLSKNIMKIKNMKDLIEMIFENINGEHNLEKLLTFKLKIIEVLYLIGLIDITEPTEYFENTRKQLFNHLRPHMTMILRSFKELAKYYTYETIFDKREGEEAQRFLDIIIDESYQLNKK